jgi:hypothetical protein
MKNLDFNLKATVSLPLELACDVLLACELAEIHIDITNELFEENQDNFSEEEIETAKSDFDRVKRLKEKFSKLFEDN